MPLAWRRPWILAALLLVVLIGIGAQLAVKRLTREPPNYTQIEPGLWLGGAVRESPPGVTAILNLCEAEDGYRATSSRWEPIRDAPPPPDLDWLAQQVEFIQTERAQGRSVYVHCQNGVSRSAFVTAAYLMQREGWSREQAIEFLRQRRPGVRPNPAFVQRLADWNGHLQNARKANEG
jgi:hypothetical protein